MIEQEYFFDKLNRVSISNFKVPVNSLLRHELYRQFCMKDDYFDRVCEYMLNNNTDITYYNMKNLFDKFSKEREKVEELAPLKYADQCEHKECNTCDIDVCIPVAKAFVSEKALWSIDPNPKECKDAINRLAEMFPLLPWTFNKVKGVRLDHNGNYSYIYEQVDVLSEMRK
jgi:hypothetical protein